MFMEQPNDELVTSMETHESRSSVINRAALILDAFGHGSDRLLLNEITVFSGLPRSTVFRLVMQLVEVGWLHRNHDQQGYRLGKPFSAYSGGYKNYSALREVAHPVLAQLQMTTGMFIHLAVLEDDGMLHFLDKFAPHTDIRFPSSVGLNYPVEKAASGWAMLAAMSKVEAERIITLREATDRLNLNWLREKLTQIRHNFGVASKNGMSSWKDILSVSAPILSPNGPIGALSVSGFDLTADASSVPIVITAAKRITASMYPDWENERKLRWAARHQVA